MRPLRRFRLLVARRPLVYWLLVGLLAMAVAAFVLNRTAAAEMTRRRWGEERLVLVAARDLTPGQSLGQGDTRAERWPIALIPGDALRVPAEGSIVAEPIGAGEPVVRRRLGRVAVGPVAGLLPIGTRGIVLPAGEAPLPIRPGDHVDVVATDAAGTGAVVAAGAPVVFVDDRIVVIAVGIPEVGAVAGAVAAGSVVLAISADPSG